jgi:hypothetical protein
VILKLPSPGRREVLAGATYGGGTYGGDVGSFGVGSRGGVAGSTGRGGVPGLDEASEPLSSGDGDRRRTGISRKWNAGGTTLLVVV